MEKALKEVQVVGLGQACVDYLGRIDSYPSEDGKVELTDFHMQGGGPASTALVTLSRLGVCTSFLGSISEDFYGREILKELQKEKVDSTFLKITPGYTSQVAFIPINRKNGKRTVFWHRGSVPHLEPKDVDLEPFPNARIYHTDGLMMAAAIEGARQAKQKGLTVVMDGGTMREGSLDLVGLVDVLIASEGFSAPFAPPDTPVEKALKALQRLGPKEVVITLGSRGSVGLKGEEFNSQEAFPVKAVDTTGAGDVYHGAYIYCLLQGASMADSMGFASATSALKCREIGARKGIPRLEEIKEFMAAKRP